MLKVTSVGGGWSWRKMEPYMVAQIAKEVKIVGILPDRVRAESLQKPKKASILLGRNAFGYNELQRDKWWCICHASCVATLECAGNHGMNDDIISLGGLIFYAQKPWHE